MFDFINDLSEGVSKRLDCPKCNGKYCFSVSLVNGDILYHCFRASCGFKGRIKDSIKIENIIDNNEKQEKKEEEYVIPNYFSSPLQNKKAFSFLKNNDLLNNYRDGLEIYFDPKLQRVVFPLRDKRKVLMGAQGRAVLNVFPKWYIYKRLNGCPYICENKDSKYCILVEDVISSIRCGFISNSITLLGTNVDESILSYIDEYEKLFVALDDDATDKSLKLQKYLSIYKPTYIIPLRKDIKYFSKDELFDIKREYLDD
jgi:hypothetical protein